MSTTNLASNLSKSSLLSLPTQSFFSVTPDKFIDNAGHTWIQEVQPGLITYKVFPPGEYPMNSSLWEAHTEEAAKRAYYQTREGITTGINVEAEGLMANQTTQPPPVSIDPTEGIRVFGNEVYEALLSPLRECVHTLVSANEKDSFLVAALAIVSGSLPNVVGIYDGKQVYPNLYAYILGKYGVGKGSLNFARMLAEPIHKAKRQEHKQAEERYKAEKAKYDSDLCEYKKDKTGSRPQPEEPTPSPIPDAFHTY